MMIQTRASVVVNVLLTLAINELDNDNHRQSMTGPIERDGPRRDEREKKTFEC